VALNVFKILIVVQDMSARINAALKDQTLVIHHPVDLVQFVWSTQLETPFAGTPSNFFFGMF
jgi:hypothetical protein